MNGKIYEILDTTEMVETNYNNFSDFYANEYQITYKTLHHIQNGTDCKPLFHKCYDKTFDELGVIGSGGFGTVLRVKHKFDGQLFAVKRIEINGN